MLPALADIDALNARLSEPATTAEDVTRAQAALEDASTLVRDVAGVTWVTAGELDATVPDVVVKVTLWAARRAYLNPDGIRQETLGDHSVTFAGSGAVYLTDDEKDLIIGAGAPRTTVPGLGSVRVIAPEQASPRYWLHDDPLEDDCV